MSEIAFHEKAGRTQVSSFVSLIDKVFSLPSCYCRHPSIRTLDERSFDEAPCLTLRDTGPFMSKPKQLMAFHDYRLGMRRIERICYFDGQREQRLQFHRTVTDHVFQCHAVQKLHGDVRLPVLLADVVILCQCPNTICSNSTV